jgi:secondary thiamine-phosphate synthase enzyme
MKILTQEIQKKTKGNCDIIDITGDITDIILKSGIKEGQCTIFSVGSTAGITTIEFEPGLLKDIPKLLDKLIPQATRYNHDDTWGDGNGHAHLRSALYKTSLSIPIYKGELTLGTWQQVVLLDFDNRGRTRRIVVQIIGE